MSIGVNKWEEGFFKFINVDFNRRAITGVIKVHFKVVKPHYILCK